MGFGPAVRSVDTFNEEVWRTLTERASAKSGSLGDGVFESKDTCFVAVQKVLELQRQHGQGLTG